MRRSRLLLSQIGQGALPLEVQHWTYFKTLWVSQTVNVALRNIFQQSVRCEYGPFPLQGRTGQIRRK